MLLAIDAGNTQTVIGLFDDSELADHWRIATVADRTEDELALMIQQFLGFHDFSFDAMVVEPGVRSGMPILYDNPKEVGPDRIANAVAAYDLYGGPSIVVDFGTATTVEAISAAG